MLGALLGGLLVVELPIEGAVASAAALYALAAMATAGQRRSAPLATPLLGLHGMVTGIRSLRRSFEGRFIVAYSCLRSLMRGLWLALAVVASFKLLGLGRSGLGTLMAAAAVGALLALAATVRLVGKPRLAGSFAIGLVLCGVPIALAGAFGVAWAAVVLMVVWGIGMALSDVCAQALLNRVVPGRSIGSVTGVMESGKLFFEGAGGLLAAALLVALGIQAAMVAVGLAMPLLVGLGYRGFARVDARATARIDVLELLHRVPFFAPLRVDALEGVAARLRRESVAAGTEVVRQGDLDARRWFLVAAGELAVELDGFVVGALHRGSQFGERGLLRGVPRSATVRAVTDVSLHVLLREDFLAAVAGIDLVEHGADLEGRSTRLDIATALARAPLIHSLGRTALSELIRESAVEEVEPGSQIVAAGGRDDTYHVLLSGSAEVTVDGEIRRELLPGDAFGEIAVLHRVARTATVTARAPCTLLTLQGDAVREAVREHGRGELAALAG
jgi:CRP-like cAMP-binding protein